MTVYSTLYWNSSFIENMIPVFMDRDNPGLRYALTWHICLSELALYGIPLLRPFLCAF